MSYRFNVGDVVYWSWFPRGKERKYTGRVVALIPSGQSSREAVQQWLAGKKPLIADNASSSRHGCREVGEDGYLVLTIPRNLSTVPQVYAPKPSLLVWKVTL